MLEIILVSLVCVVAVICVVMAVKLASLGRNISELKEALDREQSSDKSSTVVITEAIKSVRQQIVENSMQNEQKLDNIRRTIAETLNSMQESNKAELEKIRHTVDEKLQTTLEKKLNDSFSLVSARLEQVAKGLGEMQALAVGVGDLKKVLSNVKTRGILGELQLGAILEEILSPEQYSRNVATKKGSQANVEFAIKLPGSDTGVVWLPFDSKYPADAYEQLLDAYDSGDGERVSACQKTLRDRLRGFAKDIHEKYIDPPNTTDFALMFLPVEGLYAEAVKLGMIEQLQAEFKVNIAGPTTTAALLNSLQLGFRTLAVQKRSVEVWKVLSDVRVEFDTFAKVLESTQKRLSQANEDLDKLVGVRTRKIQSKLRNVQTQADGLLEDELDDESQEA